MSERNGTGDDEPGVLRFDDDALQRLVSKLRIRQMEEIEDRTGVAFDQVMTLRQGLMVHALAYAILAARDPSATWEDAGDVEIAQLRSLTSASEVAPGADPTSSAASAPDGPEPTAIGTSG
jgi:hypothetical protein